MKNKRQNATIERLMRGGMDAASASKAAAILHPEPTGASKTATDYVEQQKKARDGIRKLTERAAPGGS